MPTDKKFLSLEEVAKLLDVNYQLIYRLVRNGDLSAVRVGRVYRVTKEDLEAYLEASKTGSVKPENRCSACGRSFASTESLKNSCEVCGEPICFDCWERKGLRHCKEDGGE
jgi:excisionase family DNA binding protein